MLVLGRGAIFHLSLLLGKGPRKNSKIESLAVNKASWWTIPTQAIHYQKGKALQTIPCICIKYDAPPKWVPFDDPYQIYKGNPFYIHPCCFCFLFTRSSSASTLGSMSAQQVAWEKTKAWFGGPQCIGIRAKRWKTITDPTHVQVNIRYNWPPQQKFKMTLENSKPWIMKMYNISFFRKYIGDFPLPVML